jgi:hypothetical protein
MMMDSGGLQRGDGVEMGWIVVRWRERWRTLRRIRAEEGGSGWLWWRRGSPVKWIVEGFA